MPGLIGNCQLIPALNLVKNKFIETDGESYIVDLYWKGELKKINVYPGFPSCMKKGVWLEIGEDYIWGLVIEKAYYFFIQISKVILKLS